MIFLKSIVIGLARSLAVGTLLFILMIMIKEISTVTNNLVAWIVTCFIVFVVSSSLTYLFYPLFLPQIDSSKND